MMVTQKMPSGYVMAEWPACSHCHEQPARASRGLCWHCWKQKEIRAMYAEKKKTSPRDPTRSGERLPPGPQLNHAMRTVRFDMRLLLLAEDYPVPIPLVAMETAYPVETICEAIDNDPAWFTETGDGLSLSDTGKGKGLA